MTDHILIGILREGSTAAADVLRSFNVTTKKVAANILLTRMNERDWENEGYDSLMMEAEAMHAIGLAREAARRFGRPLVTAEDLLLGCIGVESFLAVVALSRIGLRREELASELVRRAG
jgi:ATP-dependent Clp protease ATP-binding subunit ClpA